MTVSAFWSLTGYGEEQLSGPASSWCTGRRRAPGVPRRAGNPALEDLAGIENPERVQRSPDPPMRLEPGLADLLGQERLLQQPHSVLAGDRPAELQGHPHDGLEGGPGSSYGIRIALVEHDRGVHVAVARVAERADQHRVAIGDLLDRSQEIGDPTDGHRHVVEQEIGRAHV